MKIRQYDSQELSLMLGLFFLLSAAPASADADAAAVAAVEGVIARMLGDQFVPAFNLTISATTAGETDACPVGGCFELGAATGHGNAAVVHVRGTRVSPEHASCFGCSNYDVSNNYGAPFYVPLRTA